MAGYQDMINRAVMAAVNRARETGGPNSGGVPPSNVQPLPPIRFPTPAPQTPMPMPLPVPQLQNPQMMGPASPQFGMMRNDPMAGGGGMFGRPAGALPSQMPGLVPGGAVAGPPMPRPPFGLDAPYAPSGGPATPFMPNPGGIKVYEDGSVGQIGGYANPQSPGIVAMRDAMRNGTPIPNMRLGAGAPRLPAGYPDTMPMPGSPQAQRQDPAVMALLAQLMKRRG